MSCWRSKAFSTTSSVLLLDRSAMIPSRRELSVDFAGLMNRVTTWQRACAQVNAWERTALFISARKAGNLRNVKEIKSFSHAKMLNQERSALILIVQALLHQ